jgi:pyrroloquinoline quinone biosynthesis protein D
MSDLDFNSRPSLASHARLKLDPITGEPTLLFPEGLLILNDTAHEIVRRCDGRTTIAEIAHQLAGEFDAEEDVLRADVLENLRALQQKNLLSFST